MRLHKTDKTVEIPVEIFVCAYVCLSALLSSLMVIAPLLSLIPHPQSLLRLSLFFLFQCDDATTGCLDSSLLSPLHCTHSPLLRSAV